MTNKEYSSTDVAEKKTGKDLLNFDKQKQYLEKSLKVFANYIKWIVICVIVVILFSGLTFVQQNEVALVMRLGKYLTENGEIKVLKPGPHLNFPYVIDKVIRIPVEKVQDAEIKELYTSNPIRNVTKSGYVITGDSNIVLIKFIMRYKISDPYKYLTGSITPTKCVENVCISSLVKIFSAMNVDDVLATKKNEMGQEILEYAQRRADELGLGITYANIEFPTLSAPSEVQAHFDLVTTQYVNNETLLQEAMTYADRVVSEATAESNKLIQTAKSYQSEQIAQAKTDVAQFYGVIEEYKTNPQVVSERLYREKVEKILANISSLKLLAPDESNTTVLLPK